MTDTDTLARRWRPLALLLLALTMTLVPPSTDGPLADVPIVGPALTVQDADAAESWRYEFIADGFQVRNSRTVDTFRLYDEGGDTRLVIDNYQPCLVTEHMIYTRHRWVLEGWTEGPWYWPAYSWEKVVHTDVPCAVGGARYRTIEDLPAGRYRWRVFDARDNNSVDTFDVIVQLRGGSA